MKLHFKDISFKLFPPVDMHWFQRSCHFLKVLSNCFKVIALRSVAAYSLKFCRFPDRIHNHISDYL